MKIIHHNDLDGRAAAHILYRWYKDKFHGLTDLNLSKEDFIEMNYKFPIPIEKIAKDETVYIVDYSLDSYEELERIMEVTKNITWIDHHYTSMKILREHPEIEQKITVFLSNDRSGAYLTSLYLHNATVVINVAKSNIKKYVNDFTLRAFNKQWLKTETTDCILINNEMHEIFIMNDDLLEEQRFITSVDDYDRWVKVNNDSTYLNEYYRMINPHPMDEVWDKFYDAESFYHCISQGKRIFDANTIIREVACEELSYESTYHDIKILVMPNTHGNSMSFGERFKDYPFCVTWYIDKKSGQYIYGLYGTDENFNLAEIAESFGGGGHKQAAGFKLDYLLFKKGE